MKIDFSIKQIGTVEDARTPLLAPIRFATEINGAVRDSVTKRPNIAFHYFAQDLSIFTATLHRIWRIHSALQVFKFQFTQKLESNYHWKPGKFVKWVTYQRRADNEFSQTFILSDGAHFYLSTWFNEQNCHIWPAENPRTVNERSLQSQKVSSCCDLSAHVIIGVYCFDNDAGISIVVTAQIFRVIITSVLGLI